MRDRRKRLLRTASYCVASIITDCIFAIDFSLRFSSFSRPFRDLKRIERGRSPLFSFFFSLLYSFPPLPLDVSHLHRNENIPIWRPSSQVSSLLSLAEQGMDVPCTREFVHVFARACLVLAVHLCPLSGSSYFFPSRRRNQQWRSGRQFHLAPFPTFERIRTYRRDFRHLDNGLASIASCNLFRSN